MPTRSLEHQAKHKQMIHALGRFQERIDKLAEMTHINDEAYLQLSNESCDMYNTINTIFQEIMDLKDIYEETIMNNVWTQANHPDKYHERQARTRQSKMNNPNYELCECGDWISKFNGSRGGLRRLNPRAMINHRQTEKCMSARARIKWNDPNKCKVCNIPTLKLDKYLNLNSHINYMANQEQKKLEGKEALRRLLIRRRLGILK